MLSAGALSAAATNEVSGARSPAPCGGGASHAATSSASAAMGYRRARGHVVVFIVIDFGSVLRDGRIDLVGPGVDAAGEVANARVAVVAQVARRVRAARARAAGD